MPPFPDVRLGAPERAVGPVMAGKVALLTRIIDVIGLFTLIEGIHVGTVVRGEEDQRVVPHPGLVDRVENGSHRPVHLGDEVSVLSQPCLAPEPRLGLGRLVRCGQREVEKEGRSPADAS